MSKKTTDYLIRNLGGGSILDVGCYPLSMARMIVGLINGKDFMDPEEYEVQSEINEHRIDLSSEAEINFFRWIISLSILINKRKFR